MSLCWKYWSAEVCKDFAAKKSLKDLTDQVRVIPEAQIDLKVLGKDSLQILLDHVPYFHVDSKGCRKLRGNFYDVELPCYRLYKAIYDEKLISRVTQWNSKLISVIEVVKKSNGKVMDTKKLEYRLSGTDIYICNGAQMLFKFNGKRGCTALQNKYILRLKSSFASGGDGCIIL